MSVRVSKERIERYAPYRTGGSYVVDKALNGLILSYVHTEELPPVPYRHAQSGVSVNDARVLFSGMLSHPKHRHLYEDGSLWLQTLLVAASAHAGCPVAQAVLFLADDVHAGTVRFNQKPGSNSEFGHSWVFVVSPQMARELLDSNGIVWADDAGGANDHMLLLTVTPYRELYILPRMSCGELVRLAFAQELAGYENLVLSSYNGTPRIPRHAGDRASYGARIMNLSSIAAVKELEPVLMEGLGVLLRRQQRRSDMNALCLFFRQAIHLYPTFFHMEKDLPGSWHLFRDDPMPRNELFSELPPAEAFGTEYMRKECVLRRAAAMEVWQQRFLPLASVLRVIKDSPYDPYAQDPPRGNAMFMELVANTPESSIGVPPRWLMSVWWG